MLPRQLNFVGTIEVIIDLALFAEKADSLIQMKYPSEEGGGLELGTASTRVREGVVSEPPPPSSQISQERFLEISASGTEGYSHVPSTVDFLHIGHYGQDRNPSPSRVIL